MSFIKYLFGKKRKGVSSKDAEKLQKISSNIIRVRVYKTFGSGVRILLAGFEAEEKRDTYNNIVATNPAFFFNEDLDFTTDDVYREMTVILELENKSKKECVEILDKKIIRQEKILKYLRNHVKLNAVLNYADENIRCKDYKALKNHIQNMNEDSGSFFTIEDGMRTYSYESVDGFLVPIWHGQDTYSQYPDHTRKKKINIQEEQKAREELMLARREKFAVNTLMFLIVINVILAFGFGYGVYKTWNYKMTVDERGNEIAMVCTENVARMNNAVTNILNSPAVMEMLDYQIKKENISTPPPANSPTNPIKTLLPTK